jgi:glycosyltransferase involved in cell wall biosynthesis
VISFRRGGVPEGIDHGRTGFIVDSVEQMADAVRCLPRIDRAACRADAERRFSGRAVTDAYETLYRRLIHAGSSGRH